MNMLHISWLVSGPASVSACSDKEIPVVPTWVHKESWCRVALLKFRGLPIVMEAATA